MSKKREERPAGAGPNEESTTERARMAEAIRKVFDEAIREAIPELTEGEPEGETPGP